MNVFRNELKKLLKMLKSDPKSLMAGIIAPTIILLIFFLTLGNFSSLKIAFVNNDSGSYSKELEKSIFTQISPLGNKPYFEKEIVDLKKANELFKDDKVSGIIIVDENFSKNIIDKKPASIEYHFNNYNSDMAKNLRLYLSEGLLDFNERFNSNIKDISIVEKYNVTKQIEWFDIVSVGVFMLAFFMGAMFNFLYLFHKEKVYGTLLEYQLSPKNILSSFFARVVVSLIAGTITSGVNAIFIYFLAGINLFLLIPKIVSMLLCLGFSYIFLACIIGLSAKSFNGSAVFSMVLAVLLWFLSGATASVNYATGILKTIALCIPNSYGLALIRDIVFQMKMSDLDYSSGWTIMITYMLVLMIISAYMYCKKLNKKVL
ncbi:ABC transporter permease [Streptococcus zalophi]|uniref:ABC transporter permease n=1 Tax=Streptococcus zalophi TaxID=640031 RepID=UPI00215CCC03|nr:ABC transporter permease [Streptococcus zalophi]MCR8967853.1 ABC transporter permease [Streptococcus zalophi]